MHRFSILFALLLVATICSVKTGHAQFVGQKTYCNPIDIDYKYNFEQKARGISFRSGADPVIVNHKGEYFLFVTIIN
jgi:xylan 1,4-beta-xylosidase